MTNRCDKHDITSEGRCAYCEEDAKSIKTWQDAIQSGEIFARPMELPKIYMAPSVAFTTERMNPGFLKLNLELGKSRVTLHHFTQPDLGIHTITRSPSLAPSCPVATSRRCGACGMANGSCRSTVAAWVIRLTLGTRRFIGSWSFLTGSA